jgi:ketosteroid isomerase-like protein
MRIAVALALLLGSAAPALAQEAASYKEVKAANDSYYAALSALDMPMMEKVWARSLEVTNIAPPVRPVASRGWETIKKNYEGFWSTLETITVSMEQPTITVQGQFAWIYGVEKAQRKLKNGQSQTGSNMGTSIFINRDGRWLMIFHQAAALPK